MPDTRHPHPPVAAQLGSAVTTLPRGTHELTVHLHPADLGPVSVTARVADGEIRVDLGAATEAGREALREALPDLRRELERAGFTSCQFDTGGGRTPQRRRPGREEVPIPPDQTEPAPAVVGTRRTDGLLDLHA